MSGNSPTPYGEQNLHIDAARDWLNRAESQLSDGQPILASANLMLAQAELRLLVEGIVSSASEPVAERRKSGITVGFLKPRLIGAVAMAACLIIGIAIGNIAARTSMPSIDATTPSQSLVAEIPGTNEIRQETVVPEIVPEIPEVEIVTEGTAGQDEISQQPEILITDASPSRPRRTYSPRPSPEPAIEPLPGSASVPEPSNVSETEPEPPLMTAGFAYDNLNTAELSLRTIRILTDKMSGGNAE